MCDCCDDYYCGGCGASDPMLGDKAKMLDVTPYVSIEENAAQDGDNTLVTLAEAKQHCRVDIDDDDALIQLYLNAAGDYITERTGVPTRKRGWRVFYDRLPEGRDPLVPPYPGFDAAMSTSTTLQYIDTNGDGQQLVLGSGMFIMPTHSPTPFIPAPNVDWPTDVDLSGGSVSLPLLQYWTKPDPIYAPNPNTLKVACLMLTAHWYNAREPVTTGSNATNNTVPYTLDVLLANSVQTFF